MSPIEIQKLTSTSAASAVRAHDGHPKSGTAGTRQSTASAEAPLRGVAVELRAAVSAGQPPVDNSRVEEIRNALRDGSYPIVPAQIADALIAARLMLGYSA